MRVGAYEIEKEIGRGGSAVVYRARRGDRVVALKLLEAASPAAHERFERERGILASLALEDGFVPLIDSGADQGRPWFVMPLVPGGTLRARLRGRSLPIAEIVSLGEAIATALARAHERGIVHRDLKPENVLLDAEGRPFVADLGLAKHFGGESVGTSRDALTKTGQLAGTVGYMAPEQARDAKNAGPASDVFSLGAILWECLAGYPAFEGATVLEVLGKIDRESPPPLGNVRPETPPWLASVVERALSRDERARFADGSALLAALRARVPVSVGSPRRPKAWLVGLVLLTLAVVLGALVLVPTVPVRAPDPPPPERPRALLSFETARVVRGLDAASPWAVFDAEVARVGTAAVPREALDRVFREARDRCARDVALVDQGASDRRTFPAAEAVLELAARMEASGVPVAVPSLGESVLPRLLARRAEITPDRRLRLFLRAARYRKEIGAGAEAQILEGVSRTLVTEASGLDRAAALGFAEELVAAAKESPWTNYARARVLLSRGGSPAERAEGEKALDAATRLAPASSGCAAHIGRELLLLQQDGLLGLERARVLAGRLVEIFPSLGFTHLALGKLLLVSEPGVAREGALARTELAAAESWAQTGEIELAAGLWGAVAREEDDGPAAALEHLEAHARQRTGTVVRLQARLLIESGRRAEARAVLAKAVADGIRDVPLGPGIVSLPELARRAQGADDEAGWKALAKELRVTLP